MQASSAQSLTYKKVKPSKLVFGFLAAAVTAIIASTGVAGAQSSHNSGGNVGYGGDVSVNLNVTGDNNTINVMIRYIFGG